MDRLKTIEMGDIAQDTITGLEGVVIARTEWLYGCVRFCIQPQALHDGKPVESQTFDEGQLVLIKKGHREPSLRTLTERGPVAATGGPRPDPVRRPDPRRIS